MFSSFSHASKLFLSTPSARRATERYAVQRQYVHISIHALREEGDGNGLPPVYAFWNFYPRPPRGGRQSSSVGGGHSESISIHALREEGDSNTDGRWLGLKHFYPRPPRGGRPKRSKRSKTYWTFLSTPSARRATLLMAGLSTFWSLFLSTPSARRATICCSRSSREC